MIAEANTADVNKAVVAARTAYDKTWKKMPPAERAKYIYRIARMIQERAREFAIIETLGEGWMNNEWFRFGASSLANDILMQLMKQKTGVYQSANYFSMD